MDAEAAQYFRASGMASLINSFLADACQTRPNDILAFMHQWSAEQLAVARQAQNAAGGRAQRRSRTSIMIHGGLPLTPSGQALASGGGGGGGGGLDDAEHDGSAATAPCRTLRQLVLKEHPDATRFHHTGADMDLSGVLSRVPMRDVFVDAVTASSHSHVKTLSLRGNELDAESVQLFSRAFASLPNVMNVDVSTNPDLGARGLVNLLTSMEPFMAHLVHIRLSDVGITTPIVGLTPEQSETVIDTAVTSLCASLPERLQTFSLSGNGLSRLSQKSFDAVLTAVRRLTMLSHLDVSDNGFSEPQSRAWFTAISTLPELISLIFDGNNVGVAIRALTPVRPNMLHSISVRNCRLGDHGGEYLLRYLPEIGATHLREIVCSNNGMTPRAARLFCECPSSALGFFESIDLSNNALDDECLGMVLKCLPVETMKEVRLKGVQLGRSHGTHADDVVECLAALLRGGTHMHVLDISHNPHMTYDHVSSICAAITEAASPSLELVSAYECVCCGCAGDGGDDDYQIVRSSESYEQTRSDLLDILGSCEGARAFVY
eukprot:PhM_4_TR18461/c0_g1_i2/m.77238